ncbi:DUF5991 domain-containing protein [Fibrella forsythiae]|uniref:DUF2147 domain-containing protein n=1 Tax=Fibrella forsythiae TaxID=2817061 RepID=A0ABS3JD04_9BACT|nr:DUF5991 domain-containing protein [Fibrella forsythiae]MBO0947877.1 hypothetical protein [Fibrella forsythiae]
MRTVLFIAGMWFGAAVLSGFQQTDSWLGTWSGETKDGVTYTIKVNDKYRGMNLCEVHAEGIQTFYTLECVATGTPTTLKVYYRSATDGAFYAKDRVKINDPFFVLQRTNGKVSWQWKQIFDGGVAMRKVR